MKEQHKISPAHFVGLTTYVGAAWQVFKGQISLTSGGTTNSKPSAIFTPTSDPSLSASASKFTIYQEPLALSYRFKSGSISHTRVICAPRAPPQVSFQHTKSHPFFSTPDPDPTLVGEVEHQLDLRSDKKSKNTLKSDNSTGVQIVIKFRNETSETLRVWQVPLDSDLSQEGFRREEFLIHPKMRKYVSTRMG